MDISNYAINEIIWIEFLENTSNIVEGPIMGNIFEDVSDLFPKYFKKNTYYNYKSVAKKSKKLNKTYKKLNKNYKKFIYWIKLKK